MLGFLACAAVVRRSAYLEVGSFDPRLLIEGEEELLAADLASAGWGLAYAEDLTVHHHPSTVRDARVRRWIRIRSALWFAWLRRPGPIAVLWTFRVLRAAFRDADARTVLSNPCEACPGRCESDGGATPRRAGSAGVGRAPTRTQSWADVYAAMLLPVVKAMQGYSEAGSSWIAHFVGANRKRM